MNASTSERWWASVCYLGIFVLAPIFSVKHKTEFLARHCRQGFALLTAVIVMFILLAIIDNTLGNIPILGFLISLILQLVFLLLALALSVIGFVKALSGESWNIPYLDDLAERIPVEATEAESTELI